jgi:hypothetical protein
VKPWEKAGIAASFVVTSVLGASFVFWYWADRGLDGAAIVRAILFVSIIALVHIVALRAYAAQSAAADNLPVAGSDEPAPAAAPTRTDMLSAVSPLYKSAIKLAVLQQVILLILSSLLLDSGSMFRVCSVAAIAHWMAIVMIIARRPVSPTGFDLGIIRWGFVPLGIVVGRLAPFVQAVVDH